MHDLTAPIMAFDVLCGMVKVFEVFINGRMYVRTQYNTKEIWL